MNITQNSTMHFCDECQSASESYLANSNIDDPSSITIKYYGLENMWILSKMSVHVSSQEMSYVSDIYVLFDKLSDDEYLKRFPHSIMNRNVKLVALARRMAYLNARLKKAIEIDKRLNNIFHKCGQNNVATQICDNY